MGEQHLRRVHTVLLERRLVELHQPHLTHCRRRLQLVDLVRTHAPAETLHAFGDGAR